VKNSTSIKNPGTRSENNFEMICPRHNQPSLTNLSARSRGSGEATQCRTLSFETIRDAPEVSPIRPMSSSTSGQVSGAKQLS
jgi:hypothetical protein